MARVYPGIVILTSPVRIEVRRPGDREGMHPILILEGMGSKKRVFAARARNQTVIGAIAGTEAVAQVPQFLFALSPINGLLFLGEPAGITDAVGQPDGRFRRLRSIQKLNRRIRSLVRNNADGTVFNITR